MHKTRKSSAVIFIGGDEKPKLILLYEMIKIVTAVENYKVEPGDVCIFLSGSIDNGNAALWQDELLEWLKDYQTEKNVIVFNPRRKEWNPNPNKEELDEQIEWELEALSKCSYIIMNILGNSKSPITLLELGLFHRNPGLYVFCPPLSSIDMRMLG